MESKFGAVLGRGFFFIGLANLALSILRTSQWVEGHLPEVFKVMVTLPVAILLVIIGIVVMWQTRPRKTSPSAEKRPDASHQTPEPRQQISLPHGASITAPKVGRIDYGVTLSAGPADTRANLPPSIIRGHQE